MSIEWLVPAAFAGLALVALPIAIHLLVRQQSRQVAFPSLRFLQQSPLSALRRRSIQDAALLACRVLVIAAAVAALAAPVIVTPSRQAAYAKRVARAIVLQTDADYATAVHQADGAFASSVFSRDRIGDGVTDALSWLDDQPPAAREVVIVATFRLGQLSDADLVAIPAATGVRLIPVESAPRARDIEWPVLRRQGDSFHPSAAAAPGARLQRTSRRLHLDDDGTTIADGGASPVGGEPVAIVAAPADQALADAALNAALSAGIHWPAGAPSRLVVAWRGADETSIAQAARGGQVVRMDVPSPEPTAASAVARALADALKDPARTMEPVRLTADQLARWQRSPGPPPSAAEPVDEGDRRWFWGAALVLLAAEYALRHRTRRAGGELVESSREARVA